MSLDLLRQLEAKAQQVVDRPGSVLTTASLEYPGYLDILDSRGHHHSLGYNDGRWEIDSYASGTAFEDGHSPTHSDELKTPDPLDLDKVLDALVAYLQKWDGRP